MPSLTTYLKQRANAGVKTLPQAKRAVSGKTATRQSSGTIVKSRLTSALGENFPRCKKCGGYVNASPARPHCYCGGELDYSLRRHENSAAQDARRSGEQK